MFVLAIVLLLYSTARSTRMKEEDIENKDEIVVYTSVYPIYDFTKKIAGGRVRVEMLVPPGAEPHGWEPSAKAISKIEQSQIFLYNGLGLDLWAEKIADSLSEESVKCMAVAEVETIQAMVFSKDISQGEKQQEESHHGDYDPHVWLDPTIAEEMARSIMDVFVEVDSKNENYYQENFTIFQDQLKELDQSYQEELSKVKKKNFIVSHAAFGYMAKRYGLKQIAILGLAPQAEPSPAKLVELTSLIREYDLHTIFFERLSSPKAANVLAKETGIKVEELNPIGGLTQEEMDAGQEYLSIMKENLEKLKKALQ